MFVYNIYLATNNRLPDSYRDYTSYECEFRLPLIQMPKLSALQSLFL